MACGTELMRAKILLDIRTGAHYNIYVTPPRGEGHESKQVLPMNTHENHASVNTEHHRSAAPSAHADTTSSTSRAQHTHQTTPSVPHQGAHRTPTTYGGHANHDAAQFQRPFWISLLLTLPIVIYAHLFQALFGYTAPAFPGSEYLPFLLSSIVYWYGGWVFLRGARDELRTRTPGMMTLVALAITSAYAYSVAVTFHFVAGMEFYWELATLVTIMLLGHWMELRALGSAQSALTTLAKLLPDTAERVVNGHTETVALHVIQSGDVVLVRPGARIPADGTIEEGTSELNEAMMTGESRPVRKRPGDAVIAGTINGSGSLRVRITSTGEHTALAGIMRFVAEAQTSRTRAQALADRAASWLTIIALCVAGITLVAWLIARGFDSYTLERVVTVLVVACPHALGLAIPLVIAITTTLSARNGILVRDRLALEAARNVTTVVFDKTGTLTTGKQGVVHIQPSAGMTEDEALAIAAAIEGDSEHIIAQALGWAAQERGLSLPVVQNFQALPGRGVQATIAGRRWLVGGPQLVEHTQISLPAEVAAQTRSWGAQGHTVVYLITDGMVKATFALADTIRPESWEGIATLQSQGVQVAMLTGDSADVARWVARELGITTYFAQVLPEHKAATVQALQEQGHNVAMVGDGVNDAPALAQADVGIAIGAGTDVARATAGIVLVRNDPRDIARILQISRASYRKMVENIAWAVGYNVVALPLAAGVLAGIGVVLPVWVGAILMSLSTIMVALNAQTLRRHIVTNTRLPAAGAGSPEQHTM